ncbi:MAG: hypothetical protein COV47_05545 [Candidatus Diapherotrites archaeon CG11_big_fil_rev_8_21_14_0_20_37_9]|nr:MAG: hypothetical protein COV47_05545 [Candidatus Diapherotrites archaeon CG11_big_fil_rev_8_21_14_0_20_37_9]
MGELFKKMKKGDSGNAEKEKNEPAEEAKPETKIPKAPAPTKKEIQKKNTGNDYLKNEIEKLEKEKKSEPEPKKELKKESNYVKEFGLTREVHKGYEKEIVVESRPKPAVQAQVIEPSVPQEKKEKEEIKQKIMEIEKELPPQEKVGPDNPESVPEEQKSQAEKELITNEKELIDSYGETKIYRIKGQSLPIYWTPVARPVGAEKTIINTIKEAATRIISITPYKIRDQEQRRNVYYQKIMEILRDSPELRVPKTKMRFYAETVVKEMVGYGMIDSLIKDDKLEEIMIIGPKEPVYVFHRYYEMMKTNIEFYSDNEIQDLINRIARLIGRRVDLSSPLLDARLPDGSRVNATIPPASVQGSTLTIRKFREDPYTIIDLIKNGSLSAEVAAFLWLATEGMATKPANILIAGGTGSGKTTTLNVLASFIPKSERVISIEDIAELNLPLSHWIRMETKPPGLEGTGELTMDILTKNSLRMRPDRIIVGEIRHDEAFALFTAFNTGHDGCLTGDTKIALTNGIVEIGEFTEEQMSKNETWKDGLWEVCNIKNEHINSINDEGKMQKTEIVQAKKKPYTGKIYSIKTASGTELKCTGNHPLFTLNGDLVQVKAEEILEGTLIATPRKLIRGENAKEPEIEYWSGLLHGDGNILDKKRIREKNGKQYTCNEGRVTLFTEEKEIIPKFVRFMKEKLDDTYIKIVEPDTKNDCFDVHVAGIHKSRTIQQMLDIPPGNRMKATMSNSHYISGIREFTAGFFDAEGHVDAENNALVFTCGNENYIDFFKYALLTEGIQSRKYRSKSHNSIWYRLYIYGIEQIRKFYETFPIKYTQKMKKIEKLIKSKKTGNTNVDVIKCNELIIRLLQEAKSKGYSNSEIAKRTGISQGLISFYKRKERLPSIQVTQKLCKTFKEIGINAAKLEKIANMDIFWDRIVSVYSYPYNGFVYDLTTSEKTNSFKKPHNFVAEGILVANSMGTVHANSPEETLVRVTSPPMSVPSVMLSALDLVLVQHRLHDRKKGTIRRITEIAQVVDALKGKPKVEVLFKRDAIKDALVKTKTQPNFMTLLEDLTGSTKKDIDAELAKRTEFMKRMAKEDKREMHVISQEMENYLSKK